MLHWKEGGKKQQIGVMVRELTCMPVKCGKELLVAQCLENMAKGDTSGVDGLILSK